MDIEILGIVIVNNTQGEGEDGRNNVLGSWAS